MVRTELLIDEAMHARLHALALRQGRTVSDLVRDALERTYGAGRAEDEIRTLRAIAGLWRDRRDLGSTAKYVRRLRKDAHRSPSR